MGDGEDNYVLIPESECEDQDEWPDDTEIARDIAGWQQETQQMTNIIERPQVSAALPADAKLRLTLEITPDLAVRLTHVAAYHGVPLPDFVRGLMEHAACEPVPAPSPPRFTSEEIAWRGKEWYENTIRAHVNTPENKGKAVVINIETGDYEIDADSDAALTRARARYPGALFYRVRVGYKAFAKMSGGWKDIEE